MRRLRVLWLIKGLGPGGAERLLVSAAEVHDRGAFDLEVAYLLDWKKQLAPELERIGVPTHCLGVSRPTDLRWLARFSRLLSSGHFDIVHAHSPVAAGGARLVVRALPRHRGIRLISTEHNRWSSYALSTRVLNGLTMVLDDARLAISDDVRASVWRPLRPLTKTVVHGVSPASLAAARQERHRTRGQLGATDGEVLVATVANYRAQKGYPDLLRAARAVIDQGLPARFVAIGQGPLEAEIRKLHAELDLGDRFMLLGYHPDPPVILAGCDLFTLASVYEGYPVALMEALAMGLPVVATAVGGVREAVTDGVEGFLVPPGRPDRLARALGHLVSDADERAAMARAAALRGTRYDIKAAVGHIEDVYRSVCPTPTAASDR